MLLQGGSGRDLVSEGLNGVEASLAASLKFRVEAKSGANVMSTNSVPSISSSTYKQIHFLSAYVHTECLSITHMPSSLKMLHAMN